MSDATHVFNAIRSGDPHAPRGRLQDALAPSEARAHALLEAAVDGIVSIDEQGIIQLVNPAAERLFGYSAQELIGQNISLLMPSPYGEDHDRYLARYLATAEKTIIGIGPRIDGPEKTAPPFRRTVRG
ncbi:MAG TPA: PAS domain S-box protein [Gemmataceae bacterium]|nr:PAS domain S-box protein [Gemmataceae bacterium]